MVKITDYNREVTDVDYQNVKENNDPLKYNIISVYIEKLRLNISFDNLNTRNILCLNQDFLVFDVEKEYREQFWFYFGFTLFAFLLSLTPLLAKKTNEEIPLLIWSFYFVMISLLIGQIYFFCRMPKKEFIFNRNHGLLTFPDRGRRSNNTMKFNIVKWSTYRPDHPNQSSNLSYLIVRSPKTYFYAYTSMAYFDTPEIDKSDMFLHGNSDKMTLFAWYMDKNRPLPPGTAFDPYRQKDFERRKAEGFPIPLYDASIETPEATPEQQAERLMIGGW